MIKLLVIGGDSYVGNYFIKENIKRYDITVISRVETGLEGEIICNNLNEIPDSIFNNIDIVFSLIGIAHRKEKGIESLYYQVNRDLVVKLANQAKKNNVKKFIQMSSIAVYANDKNIDIRTKANPITNYGKSKLEADHILLELNDENFKVFLIRPPMIYGPKAPGNIRLLIKLINKFPILPFKDVKNQRTFLHIENFLIYLNYLLLNSDASSGIIIISDSFNISTKELVQAVSKKINKKLFLFNSKLFCYFLRKLKPAVYDKLYGNLIVDTNLKTDIDLLSKDYCLNKI